MCIAIYKTPYTCTLRACVVVFDYLQEKDSNFIISTTILMPLSAHLPKVSHFEISSNESFIFALWEIWLLKSVNLFWTTLYLYKEKFEHITSTIRGRVLALSWSKVCLPGFEIATSKRMILPPSLYHFSTKSTQFEANCLHYWQNVPKYA